MKDRSKQGKYWGGVMGRGGTEDKKGETRGRGGCVYVAVFCFFSSSSPFFKQVLKKV